MVMFLIPISLLTSLLEMVVLSIGMVRMVMFPIQISLVTLLIIMVVLSFGKV